MRLRYVEIAHDGTHRVCWCGADILPAQVSVHRHASGDISCSQSCAIELDAIERRATENDEHHVLLKELAS